MTHATSDAQKAASLVRVRAGLAFLALVATIGALESSDSASGAGAHFGFAPVPGQARRALGRAFLSELACLAVRTIAPDATVVVLAGRTNALL